MPVDEALLELITQPADWYHKTGQDEWQDATFAAAQSILCYRVDEAHEVKDANGEKRVARGTVYTADVYGIEPGDDLRIDGESLGEIIVVKNFYDENGPYGSEVHHG